MHTEIKIEEVMTLFTASDVDKFLKKYTGFDLNEKRIDEKQITKNWKFLGGNYSNLSSIGILAKGENGITERITNAIDAVIEKQKENHHLYQPKTAGAVIKKAFPLFSEKYQSAAKGQEKDMQSFDAADQIVVALNDSGNQDKPTFDIVDLGIGVEGKDFQKTLLSLSGGNKLSADKKYLIGAFGQGGSTSLPFTEATIILSKKSKRIFFTIIKKVLLKDYKTPTYVYLVFNDKICELFFSNFQENKHLMQKNFSKYLLNFLNSETGTLVRMIETDVSKALINGGVTNPGMFVDYINTKMFATTLPIKVLENRSKYLEKIPGETLSRYAYGSEIRLKTRIRNVLKKYAGTFEVVHNNQIVKVDYYIVLPTDEKQWGIDFECRRIFKMFSYSFDPIIYTINGQTISTESYTKLKNLGLNFLKYRLLIVVNLDSLEEEKYNFVTSSRAQIKETSQTKKILEEILDKIANNDQIREMNDVIAQKSINSSALDDQELKELSSEVKNVYGELLKSLKSLTAYGKETRDSDLPKGAEGNQKNISKNILLETISSLKIVSHETKFYLDEAMKFSLETKAKKLVNQSAKISAYIDDQEYRDLMPNFMDGRIIYLSPIQKNLEFGHHELYFMLFQKNGDSLISNKFKFALVNEISPAQLVKTQNKALDLEIKLVDEGKELISEIFENHELKKIIVYINLNHENLKNEIYKQIPKNSSDKLSLVKKQIVKPVALFTLLLKDFYDEQTLEAKNKMIISHVKSIIFNSRNN